jgi:hypothetical protein
VHDLTSAIWSSALVVDGKVYIGNEDGDMPSCKPAKRREVLATISMGGAVYGTPVRCTHNSCSS